jgi:hypothetical protein
VDLDGNSVSYSVLRVSKVDMTSFVCGLPAQPTRSVGEMKRTNGFMACHDGLGNEFAFKLIPVRLASELDLL